MMRETTATDISILASAFMGLELLISYVIAHRPPLVWRLGLVGLSFAIIIRVCQTTTLGDTWQDWSAGSLIGVSFFKWLHVALIEDPIETVRHKDDKIPPKELSFSQRFYWGFSFSTTPRSIGFSNQVSNVPPALTTSRGRYIMMGLLLAFKNYLYVDLAQTYIHTNPIFQLRGNETLPITSQGLLWRAVSAWSYWACVYGMLNILHYMMGVCSVAVGAWEPADWPPFFGKFHDAYTIRRAWGHTWHQNLRRWMAPMGKRATACLGYKPGTWQSSYIQLYTAFLLSGVVHCFGDLMCDAPGGPGRSAPYFLVQALAITCEDIIVGLGKRLGIKQSRFTRYVGYVWTAAWFVWCGPLLFNILTDAGTPYVEALPFSVIRSSWEYLAPGVMLNIPWNLS